ncbi:hypothetical protein [Pedobacter steynii]
MPEEQKAKFDGHYASNVSFLWMLIL